MDIYTLDAIVLIAIDDSELGNNQNVVDSFLDSIDLLKKTYPESQQRMQVLGTLAVKANEKITDKDQQKKNYDRFEKANVKFIKQ